MDDLSGRSPSAPDKHDAWVIWLHGLGESSHRNWSHLQLLVGTDLPWLKWSTPDAAAAPVTCRAGASMPSWFDVAEVPVPAGQEIGIDGEVRISSAALEEPAGLAAAVSACHAMLRQAESMGYASRRVVLGGSGQGGALALLAGRMYDRPLGGIVSFGGWHLRPQWRPSGGAANADTPLLLVHGTHDDEVPITCLQESLDLLLRDGANVSYHPIAHAMHADGPEAQRHLQAFLRERTPRTRPPAEEPEGPLAAAAAQHKSTVTIGGQPPQPQPEPLEPQPAPQPEPTPRSAQPAGGSEAELDALSYSVVEVGGGSALRVLVELPPSDGTGPVELEVGPDEMRLVLAGARPLTVRWHEPVDADAAVAKFSKKSRELRVTVPTRRR